MDNRENMLEHYSVKTKYVRKPKAGPAENGVSTVRCGRSERYHQGLLV
jgi:hypothetical protein